MVRRCTLLLLVLISCSIHAMAQTDYYYYANGNKIPLTLNENKVVVNIPKENKEVSERVRTNTNVLDMLNDRIFDMAIITRSDYEKLTSLDSWKEDEKSVILTPCFYVGKKAEVYSIPYLTVEIKKEEDVDLLTSYMEKYKLRITYHSPLMPLWYGLCITLESEKGPIECANELYECGDFADAVPDFAGADIPDAVQSITVAPTEVSCGIFDLQGRRLSKEPAHGVYIQNGRKRIK